MSAQLISLAEAKAHLRVDHDSDDVDITAKIEEASDAVLSYLKLSGVPSAWSGATGESPGTSVPPRIKSATKLAVGILFEHRGEGVADVLSPAVRSLLHRDRDPSIA